MKHTLWRGEKLLGHFEEREAVTRDGKRVGASGLLELSDTTARTASVMQTRIRILPDRPVFQAPLDAILLGEAGQPSTRHPGPRELRPLSQEEARGVPPDQILTIRDGNDAVVDADTIVLQRLEVGDHADLAALSAATGHTITSHHIWQVSYARHHQAI